MKHIPNILTGLRILCSALLLATPVYSSRFYLFYLVCGVTDFSMPLARRLHAASKAGASLDNIADYTLLTSTSHPSASHVEMRHVADMGNLYADSPRNILNHAWVKYNGSLCSTRGK
jgi:hypothetical protein